MRARALLGALLLALGAAAREEALLAWLRAQGARADAVRVQETPHGRGLVAARPLLAGEEAFFVPASAHLTGSRALALDPELQAALARRRPGLDLGTALLPALVRHRWAGDTSPWAAYLASLPTPAEAAELFVFYQDASEVDAVLAEAPLARARVGQLLADEAGIVGNMLDFARSEPALFPVPDDELRSLLRWAYVMQLSRSWSAVDGGLGPAFLPLTDLANHGEPGAGVVDLRGDDGVALVLSAPLAAGQEVTHNYNPGGCADNVLATFGFAGGRVCGLPAVPTAADTWVAGAEALRAVAAQLAPYRAFASVEADAAAAAPSREPRRAMREVWRLRIREKRAALALLEEVEGKWGSLLS